MALELLLFCTSLVTDFVPPIVLTRNCNCQRKTTQSPSSTISDCDVSLCRATVAQCSHHKAHVRCMSLILQRGSLLQLCSTTAHVAFLENSTYSSLPATVLNYCKNPIQFCLHLWGVHLPLSNTGLHHLPFLTLIGLFLMYPNSDQYKACQGKRPQNIWALVLFELQIMKFFLLFLQGTSRRAVREGAGSNSSEGRRPNRNQVSPF